MPSNQMTRREALLSCLGYLAAFAIVGLIIAYIVWAVDYENDRELEALDCAPGEVGGFVIRKIHNNDPGGFAGYDRNGQPIYDEPGNGEVMSQRFAECMTPTPER